MCVRESDGVIPCLCAPTGGGVMFEGHTYEQYECTAAGTQLLSLSAVGETIPVPGTVQYRDDETYSHTV